jgi:hypothetical protein
MKLEQLLIDAKPSVNVEVLQIPFARLELKSDRVRTIKNRNRRWMFSFATAAAVAALAFAANIVSGGPATEVSTWKPFALAAASAADEPKFFEYANSHIAISSGEWMYTEYEVRDANGKVVRPAEGTFLDAAGRIRYTGDNTGNPFADTPPPASSIGESFFGAPWIATLPEPTKNFEETVQNLYAELVRQAKQSRLAKADNDRDTWLLNAVSQVIYSEVASPAQRLAAIDIWNRMDAVKANSYPLVQLDDEGTQWSQTVEGEGWNTVVIDVATPGILETVIFAPNAAPSLDSIDQLVAQTGWAIVDAPAVSEDDLILARFPELSAVVAAAKKSVSQG